MGLPSSGPHVFLYTSLPKGGGGANLVNKYNKTISLQNWTHFTASSTLLLV